MKDKNGNNVFPESLIAIKSYNKIKYYYVTNCDFFEQEGFNTFNGYRVNKDFTFNTYDKKRETSKLFGYYVPNDEITLIDPMPDAFKESLRTLHFWVESIIDNLGVIVKHKYTKELLRPVRFENGSYGVIRNELLDGSIEKFCHNAFEDLTYEELVEKWKVLKKIEGYEWRLRF